MSIYIYDGTFRGFLTVLAKAEGIWKEITDIRKTLLPQASLFGEVQQVVTDDELAEHLFAVVGRMISPVAQRYVWHAFLSEGEAMEMLLLRYLELGLDVGGRVDGMLAHKNVAPVHRLAGRVRHEAHRMKGFVRFMQVVEGFYYARIEPDHDVLPLIVGHFADRFADQHWLLHDLRRGKGGIYDRERKEWILTPLDLRAEPHLSGAENQCQALWRRYFEKISVDERRNLRLQQGKLPLKYRRHLTEVNGA